DIVLLGPDDEHAGIAIPRHIEVGSLGQKTLKELPRNERSSLDGDRWNRHLDEIVADHTIATLGAEGGDGVVQGDLEAGAIRRHSAAEGGQDLVRGKEGLSALVHDRDGAVARGQSKRSLRRSLTEND